MDTWFGCVGLACLDASQDKTVLRTMSCPCSPLAQELPLYDAATANPDAGEPLAHQRACVNHIKKSLLIHFLFIFLCLGSRCVLKSVFSRRDLYTEPPTF